MGTSIAEFWVDNYVVITRAARRGPESRFTISSILYLSCRVLELPRSHLKDATCVYGYQDKFIMYDTIIL